MRINFIVSIFTIHLFCLYDSYAQITEFTFTGSAGNEIFFPPDNQPENGQLTDISRGTGINPASSSGRFSANSWPITGFDVDSYYTFSINSISGFLLSLTTIELTERRSGTGIRDWSIRSSLDGFVSDIAVFNVPDDDLNRDQTINLPIDFLSLSSTTTVEFRVYAYNAESTGGSWRLDNIRLFGSIAQPDIDPPAISQATVLSSNSVVIQFSEPVDQTTSESALNYILNNTNQPISATQQTNLAEVLLVFNNDFIDGFENVLSISGIEDVSGNTLLNESVNFTFILISPAGYRDLVINEIMADPTPQVGLPDAEYVELYNASAKNIDLDGYTLNDDLIISESYILFPDQYVVLTDDANAGLFTENVIELNSMGALTNSGEYLILKDELNNQTIDSLSYEISWYKDSNKDDGGFSLELINPETECTGSNNWAASGHSDGGTPGLQNSIYDTSPDTTPPSITAINIEKPDSLVLIFNEVMNKASLLNGAYGIDNNISIVSVSIDESDLSFVSLTLNNPLESGINYEVMATGLTDCPGNLIATNSINFFYDIEPPEVVEIEPVYFDEIVITFDEPLNGISAKVKANYSIDNSIGSPSSILIESNQRIHLIFNPETPFSENTTYELSVVGVKDTLGNEIIEPLLIDFNFIAPLVPEPGDIFINEIMADPSPSVGLPEAEYIEIWNASDTTFNLNQLLLADLSSTIQLPSYDISGNEYLILTSASANQLFEPFGNVLAVSGFPSLNNSLETISLLLRDSTIVHSVSYNTEWYKDDQKEDGGYSLELINPFAACDGENNWVASMNDLGGTPGKINSIFNNLPDTSPPVVTGFEVIDSLDIHINFNEKMDESTLINSLNYQIDQGLSIANASATNSDLKSIDLTLSTPLISGVNYELSFSNLADCPGNSLVNNSISFYFDNTPPKIVEVEPIYFNEVLITFDEPLNSSSAEKEGNYFLLDIGVPVKAKVSDLLNQVTLIFIENSPMIDGIIYQLEITNLSDTLGNEAAKPQIITFEFIAPVTPQVGDLFINEIMADPSPSVGLPEAEYIEIWNASDTTFNLNQLLLVDLSGTIQLPSYDISGNEYLILTSASANQLFEPFGNVLAVSGFPSLNNSLETISLLLRDSTIVHSVSYNTEWYKDDQKEDGGYSLERIGPDTDCGSFYSWKASTDVTGGTPGKINSVYGDESEIEPISIINFEIIGVSSLQIQFSIALNIETVENALFISDQLNIDNLSLIEANVLEVEFTEPFEKGTIYSLEIDNLKNCDGSIVNDLKIEFGEGAVPAYNDLIITEIMANPNETTELPNNEYLEIFNATGKTISLKGLKLSDRSSFAALPSTLISPNEYVILTPNANTSEFTQFGNVIGLSNWPSLNNSGDIISLMLNDAYIFSVNYDNSWYKDSEKATGGWSLEMVDTNNPCGRIENWTSSENTLGGTPGQSNSISATNPDNFGPEISGAFTDDNKIFINFNEKIDPTNLNAIELLFKPEISFEKLILNNPQDDQISLISEQVLPKTTYQLTLNNLADCVGNLISPIGNTASFNLPEDAAPLDIVINEILFNPRSGGVDFVEILNQSDKHIDLKNWVLGNFDESGIINPKIITSDNLILEPGELKVFTENPIILKADYPSGNEQTFHEMDLPSLPNDSGRILLMSSDSIEVDKFQYSEDFHLQLLNDFDGVSLERISAGAPTQSQDNWKSTASTVGFATPGLSNSQNLPELQANITIQIEPRVFSPDNSGFNDFTTISYHFDASNNIANITVFDQAGRPVKKLLSNASLPTSGFITWDGTNDNFQKVRIGYYIIHFEIYDSLGGSRSFKERVVVGGRL